MYDVSEITHGKHWIRNIHNLVSIDNEAHISIIPAIFVGRHYWQMNTNNVNKTRALLQTTGDKDEPNIMFYAEIAQDHE
jgi:hypothetical protein